MTIERIVAALLILAVLMASLRLILWQRSGPSAPWRLAALLLLQPLCAGLLFLTLCPPPTPTTVTGRCCRHRSTRICSYARRATNGAIV